jgi:UDP-2-acetamido-3-amino-2,3-dideoxy-glucuronate N-acetyltransferase
MTETDDIFLHPTAVVDEGARIGPGTKVWHFSHVCRGARVGRDVNIGQNVYVAPTAVIGDGVKIQNNVSIYDGVVVEDFAFLGPSCVFTNVKTPRSEFPRKDRYDKTVVGRGATIGANATIICGVSLGRYCLVGAGAVVTRDVADFALVTGSPARPAGWVCMCGAVMEFTNTSRAVCAECSRTYRKEDGTVRPEEGYQK